MNRATDRYAPGLLPTEFEIVGTPIHEKNTDKLVDYGIVQNPFDPHVVDAASLVKSKQGANDWKEEKKKVETIVRNRRRLYRVFADFSGAIVAAAIWLWDRSDDPVVSLALPFDNINLWNFGSGSISLFNGDILRYFSPEIFDSFIQEFWVNRPVISVLILMVFFVLIRIRTNMVNATVKRSITIRNKIEKVRNSSTVLNNEEEQNNSANSDTDNSESGK